MTFFIRTSFILLSLCSAAVYANVQIHQHKAREIGENVAVPKIEIQVFKDMMDGVNVHIAVENYVLNAPDIADNPNGLSNEGVLQGHAHVFVNADKLQRLYGNDIHIPASSLKQGVNQIAISLNSHMHENWVAGEHNIVSSVFFDLSKDPIVLNNFTSQPLENKHAHH